MSDIIKVLEFIDRYYRNAAQRPELFFSSPESYEDVVIALETLRDAAVNDKDDKSEGDIGTYPGFLVSKGFESGRFSFHYKQNHGGGDIDENDFYEKYSSFLMSYLDNGRTN
jgi:hypothetical protein